MVQAYALNLSCHAVELEASLAAHCYRAYAEVCYGLIYHLVITHKACPYLI